MEDTLHYGNWSMHPIDRRRFSPACARNREPILSVLSRIFPERAHVLEIASGTGEHGAHFTAARPGWQWQPTDFSVEALESVRAWVHHVDSHNFRPPLRLDVTETSWPIEGAEAMFCANMIHISPWQCTLGLLDGAARVLSSGEPLVTYGPYKFDGHHTAPSNAAFDRSLRDRDPHWGVRDAEDIRDEAARRGLSSIETIAMPANNFCMVFRRT